MKTFSMNVPYAEKASRLELIIRFLWSIPVLIVTIIFSIIWCIAWLLQFLHILVFGKRNRTLHDWLLKYVVYSTQYTVYISLLTDERDPILPES